MGIDGIGGGGGIPGGVGGPGGPKGPGGKEFEVGAPAAGEVSEAQGSADLGRLEAGEISLDQYLDTQVEQAVSHLEGRLPADQLEFVRDSLRQELKTDPVLIELVRRATGASPA